MEAKSESEVKQPDPAKVVAAGVKWRVKKEEIRQGFAIDDGQDEDVSIGLLLHES